jgi:hypothetical protein
MKTAQAIKRKNANLAKFVHEFIKVKSRTCSCFDSRIKALIVMYQYFQDEVTRIKKERKSMVAAANKSHEEEVDKEITPQWFQAHPQDGESILLYCHPLARTISNGAERVVDGTSATYLLLLLLRKHD